MTLIRQMNTNKMYVVMVAEMSRRCTLPVVFAQGLMV